MTLWKMFQLYLAAPILIREPFLTGFSEDEQKRKKAKYSKRVLLCILFKTVYWSNPYLSLFERNWSTLSRPERSQTTVTNYTHFSIYNI